MATAVKRKLSGSTDGKPIKVAATGTAGTAIHTAVAGTTAGTFDEVYLYAQNNDTVSRILTVEFGSADAPDGNIIVPLDSKVGLKNENSNLYNPISSNGLYSILEG